MPYRRLPNTDSARIRALNAALEMGKKLVPSSLAFSQKTLQEIKYFLPTYIQAIDIYKETYNHQVDENKSFLEHQKKAKIYISHFIQVVNMAIARGEKNEKLRKYYGLSDYDNKVPPLQSEHDILDWGNKIIQGESDRISKGKAPITNPTAAMVKVMFEKYLNAHQQQKTLKAKSQKTLEKVGELRDKADEIIVRLWNEIENSFDKLPNDIKREKASEYGIVYVYRKNEVSNFRNVNYQAS